MPSSKVSSSEEFLIKQLRQQIAGNYAAFWNSDRDVLCLRVLKDLVREIGTQRTEEAVHSCIRHESNFTEERLRQHIPEKKLSANYCDRCRNTEGYIYVFVDGDRSKLPRTLKCRHTRETHFNVLIGPLDSQEKRHAVTCDSIQQ